MLDGRRVLVRADLDLPEAALSGGACPALEQALPTFRHVLSAGGRLIVAAHAGGTGGHEPPSLEPLGVRLSELLALEVYLPDDCIGEAARKVVRDLRAGQLCLLENLDYYPEERENDEGFARALAELGDVYVNDAPGAARDRRASVVALPRGMRERGAGRALLGAVSAAARLKERASRPLLAVLGGGDAAERMALAERLLPRVNTICAGGALGNTLLAARGVALGAVESNLLARARNLLAEARNRSVELVLPVDLVVAEVETAEAGQTLTPGSIERGSFSFDVGPATVTLFSERAAAAAAVLWVGPLGVSENPAFAGGTVGFGRNLADSVAFGVVLGGATLGALARSDEGLVQKYGFASTATASFLDLYEGRRLVSLEALRGGGT